MQFNYTTYYNSTESCLNVCIECFLIISSKLGWHGKRTRYFNGIITNNIATKPMQQLFVDGMRSWTHIVTIDVTIIVTICSVGRRCDSILILMDLPCVPVMMPWCPSSFQTDWKLNVLWWDGRGRGMSNEAVDMWLR